MKKIFGNARTFDKTNAVAINEQLTARVRTLLQLVPGVEEKKMFSGIAFMVNDKMCISVGNNRLMLRIDPELQGQLITEKGCSPMIMRGREMKGYVLVSETVLSTKKELEYWTNLALAFNPKAKSSKKKK